MKTFREFIVLAERVENVKGPRPTRKPGESFADFTSRVRSWSSGGADTGLHPDLDPSSQEKVRNKGKNTNVSSKDAGFGGKTKPQEPPKGTQTSTQQPTGTSQTPPKGAQASPGNTPSPRNTQASSAPPRSSSSGLSSTVKPPVAPPKGPGLRSRLGSVVGPAASVGSAAYDYKERRSQGQSRTQAATGAVASGAGSELGWRAGMRGGAALGSRIGGLKGAAVGGVLGGIAGSLGGSSAASSLSDKLTGGRKAPTEKDFEIAKQRYGVTQSRKISAQSGTYGANKGSALTGIGGKTTTSKDAKGAAFMSTGAGSQRKTVQLAKTQLVRDPKTGKQVVGDLAFKGGKATYLARPSVASRDTGLGGVFRNISRSTGIGGQRERDTAAAKQEYRTALKNTQTYQKKLGITPKAATAQKLPGRGVGPAKVGPKLVGPKIVGPKKVGTGAKPSATVKPA